MFQKQLKQRKQTRQEFTAQFTRLTWTNGALSGNTVKHGHTIVIGRT